MRGFVPQTNSPQRTISAQRQPDSGQSGPGKDTQRWVGSAEPSDITYGASAQTSLSRRPPPHPNYKSIRLPHHIVSPLTARSP